MRAALALAVVLALAPAGAMAQSSLGGAGSVPPPSAVARPETAPANRPGVAAPPRPSQAPTQPRAQARTRPSGQQARPQGQQARPAGQRPPRQQAGQRPRGTQQGQGTRRAATAAAGAGAAAAGAGAAAAPAQPPPPPEPQPSIGSTTGLPLPRFTALGSNDVNLRVGPGRRFPVEWRYQRTDLPVLIIREHEEWRRIRDPDGTEGWLNAATLRPGRRTFMVRGEAGGEVLLRRRADEQAAPVARLRPGVIGRIRSCEKDNIWCEVQVQDRRGYLRRADIFGVSAEEEIR